MKSHQVLKNLTALALVAVAGLSQNVRAREKAGNGGNAAVCFNSPAEVKRIKENDNRIANDQMSKITSIQALELYQAQAAFPNDPLAQHFILPGAKEDGMDYVKRITSRFEFTLPDLRDQLNARAARFNPKKYSYYTKGGIDHIYDTAEKYYLDPAKCVVATLIRRTTVGDHIELEFDSRLFNHRLHSNVSRGVLMLHEVTYQWGQDLKQEDSAFTRRLITNALIRRDLDRKDLLDELENSGFKVDTETSTPGGHYVNNVIYPLRRQMDDTPTSKAFQGTLSKMGMDPLDVYDFKTLRDVYRTVAFDKPLGKYLPGGESAEVNALQSAYNKVHYDFDYCSSSKEQLGGKEFRRCRRLLPSLKTQVAEAAANLAAAQAAQQAKMEKVAAQVLPILQAEYERLAAEDSTKIAAKVAEVKTLPGLSDDAKAEIEKGLAQDAQYYQVPILNGAKPYVWSRYAFDAFWSGNPVIPVIE
jgi:hypothetical protein